MLLINPNRRGTHQRWRESMRAHKDADVMLHLLQCYRPPISSGAGTSSICRSTAAEKMSEPQVPTIVDEDADYALFESHAILRYLATKFNCSDHWYPRDPKVRGRVDAYLDWHHGNLRRGAAGLCMAALFSKFLRPDLSEERRKQMVQEATATLKQAAKRINDSYLAQGPYLMGQKEISIADLSAVQELVMVDLVGFDYQTNYPNIKAWVERVKKRTEKNWSTTNAVLDKVVAKNRAKTFQTTTSVTANKTAGGQVKENHTAGEEVAWSKAGSALKTGALMSEIASQLSGPEGTDAIKKLQATFKFIIGDPKDKGAAWLLDLKNGGVKELTGDEISNTKADSTFALSDDNFVALATGKVNPQVAFMAGKLKLTGNLSKAMAFNTNVFQKQSIKAKLQDAAAKILPRAKL